MKWCFGIITSDDSPYLQSVIASINLYGPPKGDREIIVVGGNHQCFEADIWIPFDEWIKRCWITKKKNLIAQVSNADRICFMHDYVALCDGWWDGVNSHHYPWITCMHRILNRDGSRFRDWCAIFNDAWMDPPIDDQKPPDGNGIMLQYENKDYGRWQYYSGAYFCTLRTAILEIPLDENRGWGQGEDVQWSRLMYKRWNQHAFHMNPHASVQFLKQKTPATWEFGEPI